MVLQPRAMLALGVLYAARAVCAAPDADEKARQDMQAALNKEVMSQPFNAGDIKKAEAYAEQAKKDNVVPVAVAPNYWVPGWTCANLTSYAYYNYGVYQNCVYYHHYYGRYWR